ncbi:MAG: sugar-binding protein [Schwartzia sp.]|nr:sugar-binding protein [Schwartzia sp. (in: firmicutes)]
MKRWTRLLALALCVLGLMTLAGCGGQEKSAAKRKVSILFANTSEIWYRNGYALQEALEKDGFLVDLYFETKEAQQIEDFRAAIAKHPVAIIVGAVNGSALQNVLADAQQRDIPVIAYDRMIMGSPHISYFVGFDSEAIGRAQGRAIEKALRLKEGNASHNIELFAGDSRDVNAGLFFKGAMDILKPYIEARRLEIPSNDRVFSQVVTQKWNAEHAKGRMERILQTAYVNGRKLDAVLAPNDELAKGIRAALDGIYKGEMPFVTGLDADPEALRAIAAGRQGMTIEKPPALLVKECLRLVHGLAEGKAPEANAQLDNGARHVPSFLCEPVVIDKDNLDRAGTAR